jgi:hypothetical protein
MDGEVDQQGQEGVAARSSGGSDGPAVRYVPARMDDDGITCKRMPSLLPMNRGGERRTALGAQCWSHVAQGRW